VTTVLDVNDNLRSWDDDMIAGSVHPMELFEFFYVLRKNSWEGVWQLDQFPFREDTVKAAKQAIRFLRRVQRGLERLDFDAMQAAQDAQDAVEATRLASDALFGDLAD
jgi:xylose isomerase